MLWFAGQSASLFLVVALAYLEMQPQPHAPRPHVAPPKGPDLTAVPDVPFPSAEAPAKPATKAEPPADESEKPGGEPEQPAEKSEQSVNQPTKDSP